MLQHLIQFIERTHLNLNLQLQTLLVQILVATVDGIHDTTGEVHVVVLQQDHVEESDAMVTTTADLHGLLLQHTHARGGLTGIQHTSASTLQPLHILIRHRGNAAHALHDVQHQALRLQQRAHTTCDDHGDVALLHTAAIAHQHLHLHLRIETAEHLLGNLHASQDTVLLDEQMRLAHRVLRNTTHGGMVAITYIFCKRQINQSVNKFFNA